MAGRRRTKDAHQEWIKPLSEVPVCPMQSFTEMTGSAIPLSSSPLIPFFRPAADPKQVRAGIGS